VLRAVGLAPRPSGRLRCGLLPVLLAVTAVLLTAPGCGQPPADGAPDWGANAAAVTAPAPDLAVWAGDSELASWGTIASDRIAAATGLRVTVSEENFDGVPMFWSTGIEDDGWWGVCHDGATDWIAVTPHTPLELRQTVVLHEMLHALGAVHIDVGLGVMSPQIWQPETLTEADIDSLCGVNDCTAFAPER
jgi:hypothetical protein